VIRCDLLDQAISERILEVVQPAQLEMAVAALEELEKREQASSRQWHMRIERAEYEAQLAERRYMETDPSNRLVASTLEERWTAALVALEQTKQQFSDFRNKEHHTATPEQKHQILALARDFPRLWKNPGTKAKDKKRMLRLLIKDITVEKILSPKQAVLHIRWQGGLCEDISVNFPPKMPDRLRYSEELVQRVKSLASQLTDEQTATLLNGERRASATGKSFTVDMIRWIRFKHGIRADGQTDSNELTVQQVADHFKVSPHVVYYWIERGIVEARRRNNGSPYRIAIDAQKEKELREWTQNSKRITRQREQETREFLSPAEGGAS